MLSDQGLEAKTLRAYLYGLQYFRRKCLTIRHLKVLLTTELLTIDDNRGGFPSAPVIASHLKLSAAQIKSELSDLVEMRLIHEIMPRFGDCDKTTYKLGSLGGSFMKKILDR